MAVVAAAGERRKTGHLYKEGDGGGTKGVRCSSPTKFMIISPYHGPYSMPIINSTESPSGCLHARHIASLPLL